MDDTISRRAAIEALDKYAATLNPDKDNKELWRVNSIKSFIEQFPAAQPHWTPCSERLPEKGQGCLVCDKGTILIDTFLGQGNPYKWRWYVRDYEAWMPLPEPYQKGATDEADRR